MARIFYSMAGEGRGHAARVRTLTEHLRHEHEVVLFAPDDAYDFLERCYGVNSPVPNVRLLRIPGIRFHYTNRKLDLLKSISSGLKYAFFGLPRLVTAFRRRMQAERPDLVITDFEPALPRAALRERVPVLAIDHQHVLLANDLRDLSWGLRVHAWSISWAVWLYYPRLKHVVVSSFYTPPMRRGWEYVQQVGPLIRPEVVAARPENGGYLLSYLRANTPESVVEMLQQLDRPIKIYGMGERPSQGQLTFCPIHETRFVDDLAACEAVICAAGNQLLGEALFLGKPVLAVPEVQHHEQQINAHYLKQMGVGDWSILEELTFERLQKFLQRLPEFQQELARRPSRFNGTEETLAAIQRLLPAGSNSSSARLPALDSSLM